MKSVKGIIETIKINSVQFNVSNISKKSYLFSEVHTAKLPNLEITHRQSGQIYVLYFTMLFQLRRLPEKDGHLFKKTSNSELL